MQHTVAHIKEFLVTVYLLITEEFCEKQSYSLLKINLLKKCETNESSNSFKGHETSKVSDGKWISFTLQWERESVTYGFQWQMDEQPQQTPLSKEVRLSDSSSFEKQLFNFTIVEETTIGELLFQ